MFFCCIYLRKLVYQHFISFVDTFSSSHQEMFLYKVVLKICSKFTGEYPCRSAISINLLCNFIEIAFWHGCSPVNLLHIFRTPFPKNTSGGLLVYITEHRFTLIILSNVSLCSMNLVEIYKVSFPLPDDKQLKSIP